MKALDGVSTVKRRNRRILHELRCTACEGVGVVRGINNGGNFFLCQPCNGTGLVPASVRGVSQ